MPVEIALSPVVEPGLPEAPVDPYVLPEVICEMNDQDDFAEEDVDDFDEDDFDDDFDDDFEEEWEEEDEFDDDEFDDGFGKK